MNFIETGKYIVLEGGDNVGKTTQAALLAESLGAKQVREPGGTEAGERIRSLLLDPEIQTSHVTEVLLHAAQRAELADTVIRPTLKRGQHVVSDRSWLSSAAYQGSQGAQYEKIEMVNRYALGWLIEPSLLLVLDANPKEVSGRSADEPDYYEGMDDSFHQSVRERFLALSEKAGGVVLDASGSVEEVSARIRETVADKLGI